MKQAYLIIAHNKIEQLKFLISLLDYEKHDIFILFDKKAKISTSEKNSIHKVSKSSKIIILEDIPIYWGDYSLVEAEMNLFKAARLNDNYSFYHLLSGVDLPLDTAENIYSFFERNSKKNFVHMKSDEEIRNGKIREGVQFYQLFPKIKRRTVKNNILGYIVAIYRKFERLVQRFLKIDRISEYDIDIKSGSQWCSLNQELLDIILEEELIKKVFTMSVCPDAMFIQTIVAKHKLENTLYDLHTEGALRYIDFSKPYNSGPSVLTDSDEDIEKLKKSKSDGYLFSERKGSLFARKFDLEKYPKMKERIFEVINEKVNRD